MGELLARLRRHPAATSRLLLASLVINLLGLASSLFVIQVLNRYVGHGVGATLFTLTVGVVIAIAGEHAFRTLRLALAAEIVGDGDERLTTGLFGMLLTAKLTDLEARPRGEGEELVRGLERVEMAFGPSALAAVADVPYSALFLVVLFLLAPALGVIASAFAAGIAFSTISSQRRLDQPMRQGQAAAQAVSALVGQAGQAMDTVRHFRGTPLLMARWQEATARARALRSLLALQSNSSSSLSQAAQALMGVAIIAVGAMLAVDGKLDVGALIGANLIAGRALAPIVRLAQMGQGLKQAEAGLRAARAFANQVRTEPNGGAELPVYRGGMELRSLGFTPPGQVMPLFGPIDLILEPGQVLAITGRNGAGKTSLARLMVGLIDPTSGQVFADGVDLRQLAPMWWRGQVSYCPQEPVFLDGSIRDNLAAARPSLSEEEMRQCLKRADLGRFVDEHPAGLDRLLPFGGRTLSQGVRRRLALARALAVDGPLVVMDEPSEGLDREGTEVVYGLLIELAQRGRTLVVISHDANIVKGAQRVLDLHGAGRQSLIGGVA